MKTSLPRTEPLTLTASPAGIATLMFTSVASAAARIAAKPVPTTLSEHLRALFMAITAFYHAHDDIKMSTSMRALLLSMYTAADDRHGAHKVVLTEALGKITGSATLLSDRGIRDAIAGCAIALYRAA